MLNAKQLFGVLIDTRILNSLTDLTQVLPGLRLYDAGRGVHPGGGTCILGCF